CRSLPFLANPPEGNPSITVQGSVHQLYGCRVIRYGGSDHSHFRAYLHWYFLDFKELLFDWKSELSVLNHSRRRFDKRWLLYNHFLQQHLSFFDSERCKICRELISVFPAFTRRVYCHNYSHVSNHSRSVARVNKRHVGFSNFYKHIPV